MKTVAYLRVSTDEQAKKGVSLPDQEASIRAYCTMRGLDLVRIFREEGVRAGIPLGKRPEGAHLVEMLAKKAGPRHVVAWKLDRLFRDAADALTWAKKWDQQKTALHIVDLGGAAVDTISATGRFMFTMLAGAAEMEKNLIGERTREALRYKRDRREVYTAVLPLGFDQKAGKLIENRVEMKTVRKIQTMRAAGATLREIAAALGASKAPTKCGGKWHAVTIQKVLRNAVYKAA